MGYVMILTDRKDDNEENHYNDDNNDTRYMVQDGVWLIILVYFISIPHMTSFYMNGKLYFEMFQNSYLIF